MHEGREEGEGFMNVLIRAAVTVYVFFMLFSTFALSEERTLTPSTPDIMIQSYPLSIEQKLARDLSTPRYSLSKEQKIKEELTILTSFAFIDYNQSVAMFFGTGGYNEVNPILGPKPSKGDMVVFGTMGIGLFYFLSATLPDPWRQLVVDSIIASERMNIEDNRRVYQGWNTDGPPIRGRFIPGIPIILSLRF
jgi:hypothetical protein